MNEEIYNFSATITLNLKDCIYADNEEEAEVKILDRIKDFIEATVDSEYCITDGACYDYEID